MIKFNLIISSTKRSLKYLEGFVKYNLLPNYVIFYSKKKSKEITNILIKKKINFIQLKTNDINDEIVENEIMKTKYNLFIYSGYPGQIIRTKNILKKRILHAHPGSLYDFKGSTTLYYSLILKKLIYCSVLKLNKKIDSGSVLYKKKFLLPKKIKLKQFEEKFDNEVRISTILEYLNISVGKKKNSNEKFYSKSLTSSYYICHPIIRGLAFNKKFH